MKKTEEETCAVCHGPLDDLDHLRDGYMICVHCFETRPPEEDWKIVYEITSSCCGASITENGAFCTDCLEHV